MKTFYLIDGHAQFFRAFHAIRTPMSSPVTKEPTNATFGFVGMLLKLFRQYKPDYLAVAIDVSGDRETFRSEIYPEYKANRQPAPEALHPQVDRCVALLKEIGVPVVFAEGFEADDVIATLATRLSAEGLKVRIVSKDKDLKQLLAEDRVELFDIHTDEAIDVAKLMAEDGITPAQVIDMLTLMGDTVDNVPGVDGVGPKTACELIKQYGTLDNLIAHAAEIKGKRGEKLREAIPRLPLSKRLITLRHDVPIALALEETDVSKLHIERLLPRMKELGFNRYQDDVRALLGMPGRGDESSAATAPSPDSPASLNRAQTVDAAMTAARESRKSPAPAHADDGAGTLFAGGLFAAQSASTPRKAESGRYRSITTIEDLRALTKEMQQSPIFAFDTETTGLSPLTCKLCGISISTAVGTGAYIPIRSPDPTQHLTEQQVLAELRPILEDPIHPRCGHNLKFDMLVMRSAGVEVGGIGQVSSNTPGSAFDSMVSSYLIDASRSSHGMDSLALALLGRTNISITELIGTGKNQRTFDTVELGLATEYAAEDADVSLQLYEAMSPQLNTMGLRKLFDDVEMPLVGVLADLEWNGIIVDRDELKRQEARLTGRIDELRKKIIDASPWAFNPDSPKQLAQALFNKPTDDPPGLGLKPGKKLKTGYSTDIEVLEKLASDADCPSPVPGLIVEYRQLTKLVGTYLIALREAINPNTGRIHSSFHQTVAATGRLASSDPNLQNIPIRTDVGREIRKAFVAPPGKLLISADYSQIELRLLAHLSRDPALKQAFERGEDIHTAVAAQIHNVALSEVTKAQRNGAKMVNFGIVYGVTPFGLARRLGVSNDAAAEIITGYKKKFAGITTFLQECIDQAQRHGYVETILKRRRPITGIDSRNPAERALAERTAINSVVQGSAADLIKVAMVNIAREIGRRDQPTPNAAWPDLLMLLQIHDELVFECPEPRVGPATAFIVQHMESAMKLDVPLKVDASSGRNWFEGK